MQPLAGPEEEAEEPQEETLQQEEEDWVHLDPQAVEALCRTLQHHLHKYLLQQQPMFER